MAFCDNLIYLRKQLNMTQEELAEQLGVTRQTISKWEGGLCYPEMDKILALCYLTGCSLETLMRGSLASEQSVESNDDPPRVRQSFNGVCRFAAGIASGVFFVLLGVALCVFFSSFQTELMENIGAAILFVFLAVAVFLFIISSFSRRDINGTKKSIRYPAALCAQVAKRQAVTTAVATVLILLSVAVLILFSSLPDPQLTRVTAGFLLMLGISVFLYVYDGIRYECVVKSSKQKPTPKRIAEALNGVIMCVATAIFLLSGFLFSMWHPMWVVFPIAGCTCGLISNVAGASDASEDDSDSREDATDGEEE